MVVLGVAAELAAFAWTDVAHWLPDLLAGWALLAAGLLAWDRLHARIGALLVASGSAWFAGDLVASLTYLHRGPLIHLLLSYPDGRVRGRLLQVSVFAAYVASLSASVWKDQAVVVAIAVGLVALAAARYRAAIGEERRAARLALHAASWTAIVLAGATLLRTAVATGAMTEATLVGFDLSIAALAIALLLGLARTPWKRPPVTDLVVDLAERREGSLRAALARALGDPGLEVAYPLAGGRGWVDATGRPLALPAPGSARRVTYIDREGEVVAALVHDSAVPEDPVLTDALGTAAGLAALNAQLQADVRDRVADLELSRRRLVRAADDERDRLEERLRETTERHLNEAVPLIEQARALATDGPAESLKRAHAQLEGTIEDLRALASGLRQRDMTERGLAAAIASLAEHGPVPVRVSVTNRRFPAEVERAAYFVCAEALANVAKHAAATQASIRVDATNGTLRLEVSDDGRGGADATRGSGLRGLADRAEALGGVLAIDSRPGQGTRLVAKLPLEGLS